MSNTPNMNLTEPVVSGSEDVWGAEINSDLTIIDSHDHTEGKGVPIPTAAISIDDDLAFNNFDATDLRSTRFDNQFAPLAGTDDIQCLYVADGDLWYNDELGNQIRITDGGEIVVPTFANYILHSVLSDLTIDAVDTFNYLVVNTGSPRNITLPLAAAVPSGRFYILKDLTGTSNLHNINVICSGLDNIDGIYSSVLLNLPGGSWMLVSNGLDGWYLTTDANKGMMNGNFGINEQNTTIRGTAVDIQSYAGNARLVAAGGNLILGGGDIIASGAGLTIAMSQDSEIHSVQDMTVDADQTATLSGNVANVTGTSTTTVHSGGTATVSSDTDVNLQAGDNLNLSATNGIDVNSAIRVNSTLDVVGTVEGTLTVNANTTVNGTSDFDGDVTFSNNQNTFFGYLTVHNKIALTSNGRILYTFVLAANADTAYNIQTYNQLIIPFGNSTHNYTLTDDYVGTSGDAGILMKMANLSSNNQNIFAFGGSFVLASQEWNTWMKTGTSWLRIEKGTLV